MLLRCLAATGYPFDCRERKGKIAEKASFCSLVELQVFQAFLIEAATKFVALGFFFVPMQVGVAEKTYAIVFSTLGLPLAAAVAMSFVRRIRTIVVSVIGLMALARMTRH